MNNLHSILEEAQVLARDNRLCFVDGQDFQPMGPTYSLLSSQTSLKPHAHKIIKSPKKRSWKKPKDKPKRPLSAYNLFFQNERKKIIAVLPEDKTFENDGLTEEQRRRKHRKTHGKIGFSDLARAIAEKWKTLDCSERTIFESQAMADKRRYSAELEAWKEVQTNSGDEVIRPAQKKVKPSTSPPKVGLPKPSADGEQSLAGIPAHALQPEALTSLITCNLRSELVRLMTNYQAFPLHQHGMVLPSQQHVPMPNYCSDQLLKQGSECVHQLHLSSFNRFGMNHSPPRSNQYKVIDLTNSSSDVDICLPRHLYNPESVFFPNESSLEDLDDPRNPCGFFDEESKTTHDEDFESLVSIFD